MFRRGKSPGQSAEEVDRQALFERLAQRPETVCPFLGLAAARADFEEQATDEHRCFAFGDPEPVSGEQQRNVCLQRGYANCPRYLRGVLVIPSDELEALRRPPQRVPPPPPPPAPPPPRPGGAGSRRPLVVVLLLLLLIGGGAGIWWLAVGQGPVAVNPTPSPLPSPSATPFGSTTPGQSEAESSFPVTPSPDATPEAGDEFIGYEVTVLAGNYDVFKVDDAGAIVRTSNAFFNTFSQAPVDRIEAANGLLHWRVTQGETTGWSYVQDQSGPFQIRAVYRGSDGSLRYTVLGPDEI